MMNMEYRILNNGVQMPAAGFGTHGICAVRNAFPALPKQSLLDTV